MYNKVLNNINLKITIMKFQLSNKDLSKLSIRGTRKGKTHKASKKNLRALRMYENKFGEDLLTQSQI